MRIPMDCRKVSEYEELMVTMLVRQMRDHLKVVANTLVFTEIHREVMIGLIDELYRVLNGKEDRDED